MSEPFLIPVGERIERFCSPGPALDTCDPEREALADELADLAEAEHEAECREFGQLVGYLPQLEQHAVRLHLRGLTHHQIGERLGVTHQNISYRLARALERLQFLAGTSYAGFAETLESDLLGAGIGQDTARTMLCYYRANSYAHVAKELGLSGPSVQAIVGQGIEALRRAGPRYARHLELYEALRSRPNLLCEVATQPKRAAARQPCNTSDEPQCVPDTTVPRELRDVTPGERDSMRALLADGWTTPRIAEQYGLDPAYTGWLLYGDWGEPDRGERPQTKLPKSRLQAEGSISADTTGRTTRYRARAFVDGRWRHVGVFRSREDAERFLEESSAKLLHVRS